MSISQRELCARKGNRGSGVALAMCRRLSDVHVAENKWINIRQTEIKQTQRKRSETSETNQRDI